MCHCHCHCHCTTEGDDGGDKIAMMHCAGTDQRKGEMSVMSSTSQLPLVNLETNTWMFVILDEGCNAAVHTMAWEMAAERFLSQQNHKLGPLRRKPKQYKGPKGATTFGRRIVLCGIRLSRGQHFDWRGQVVRDSQDRQVYIVVTTGTAHAKSRNLEITVKCTEVRGSCLRATCTCDFEEMRQAFTEVAPNILVAACVW